MNQENYPFHQPSDSQSEVSGFDPTIGPHQVVESGESGHQTKSIGYNLDMKETFQKVFDKNLNKCW